MDTDACRNNCDEAVCGDGVVQEGEEECDLGGANSQAPDANCREDCTAQRCGDGIVDVSREGDDGNDINGDGCSTCTVDCPSAPPNALRPAQLYGYCWYLGQGGESCDQVCGALSPEKT